MNMTPLLAWLGLAAVILIIVGGVKFLARHPEWLKRKPAAATSGTQSSQASATTPAQKKSIPYKGLLIWIVVILVGIFILATDGIQLWNFLTGGPAPTANERSILFDPPTVHVRAESASARTVGVVCNQERRPIRLRDQLWTREHDVPQGCQAHVAPLPDPSKYEIQCRDLSGRLTSACDEYTTITFRRSDDNKDTDFRLQLWFEPIGAS